MRGKRRRRTARATRATRVPPRGSDKIDPVSRPEYNVQAILTQSVLLEEHLSQPHKRCPDCITKHMLHLKGLAEEALSLAGQNPQRYPSLRTLGRFYQEVFSLWMSQRGRTDAGMTLLAAKLRDKRKQLVKLYLTPAHPRSSSKLHRCASCQQHA